MKILHTYCLNYNIGDYALGIGLKNLLRKYFVVDLIGETNIQGRQFDKYYIKEVVNKKYDLLVIGGGGIIHGKHWPNGWFWLIDKKLIKEITIPFIIYGAGYNYWKEEGGIPSRGITHLEETIKYAKYFSVRNDESAKRLFDDTGIIVPSIPDPGFHVNINSKYNKELKDPYVIIQLAYDKSVNRFGGNATRDRFINDMRQVTIYLSEKFKVVFAPHVFDDIVLSHKIAQGIKNTIIWDFGYFAFDHIDKAIGYYKYAEFVIAMRGHGQIIPIGFNTPVIAIENHPKHRGLMEELDLIDYSINVSDQNFKGIMIEKIKEIEKNKLLLLEKYQNINEKLMESTNKAFEDIIRSILS